MQIKPELDIHALPPLQIKSRNVSDLVRTDCHQTVRQMAEELNTSKTSVHKVLKKELNLSKVAPKVVPKLLTPEQKAFRVCLCQLNLDALKADDNYLNKFVTGDESWVIIFEMETKQGSCEWVLKGNRVVHPVKAKRQRSECKAMLTVFYDHKGCIFTQFKPPTDTVNADTYCEVLSLKKTSGGRDQRSGEEGISTCTMTMRPRIRQTSLSPSLDPVTLTWPPTHPTARTWLLVTFFFSRG